MSSFIINVQNTSGEKGTVIADVGFSYSEKMGDINEGQLRITGTGETKRGLFEIGSEVFIYRNGTLEFHGFINSLSFLDAGGISADLYGYEVWMGKENGDYAGSPWSSTASATIASAIVGESNYFTMGTNEAGESLDFRVQPTSSLWNALSSLVKRTGQDVGIDYVNSEIDVLDHKGSSTSVATLNDGIQMQDLTVRHAYPIANDVRVYGQSEGETRIESNPGSSGQDATSKSNYGTIRKIYDDPTVVSVAEANTLANKLVAKWKDPVKIYEFDVMNPGLNVVAGDVITLNSQAKDLDNEEVRIVNVERGFRAGNEFLTLTVANKGYSQVERTVSRALAELENRANDLQNYDQYPDEYSNQNIATYIGGCSYFDDVLACILGQGLIGSGVCGCSGDWTYLNGHLSVPGGVVQMCLLNVNASSIYNYIAGDLIITGELTLGAYCFPNTDGTTGQVLCTDGSGQLAWGEGGGGGSDFWVDAANPYIAPCNSCGLCMSENIIDGTGLNCMGIASSPGAWKEIHGCCIEAATHVCGPLVYGSTLVCGGDVCAVDDLFVGDDATIGGNAAVTGCLSATQIGINGSSACALYVAGNGYVTGNLYGNLVCGPSICGTSTVRGASVCGTTCVDSNIVCGDCTYACRRLKVPVGVNCF